jgi:hypothetical protein
LETFSVATKSNTIDAQHRSNQKESNKIRTPNGGPMTVARLTYTARTQRANTKARDSHTRATDIAIAHARNSITHQKETITR